MDLEAYFESINLAEIDRYIDEGQEENVNLEFKTVNHPIYNNSNREFDKKNLSEVISGFANSNGGIVIWGIYAKENNKKQDVAFKKGPIKELTKFLNILNRLEGQAVTPVVTGIIHKKIEDSNDEGYIKTYIPESKMAPHMANYCNKHYYKRSGDSFYICEHYDIRDMFQRRTSAELDLIVNENPDKKTMGEQIVYKIVISIINIGKNLAKAPLVRIKINSPYAFCAYGLDGNGNVGLFKSRSNPSSKQLNIYQGGQDTIIYPELSYDIDKIEISVPKYCCELPELVIEYMIVAENFDKVIRSKNITIQV